MSDASKQDPSTFDPDEDLFNFDEVALEFYSANDEEDLEEIFRAFEEGLDSDDDLGFDLDDNVVGCVALHEYDGRLGEVACLYVKQSHEKLGYGRILVEAAEAKARDRQLERVFALTNRAAAFFTGHLGYVEAGGDLIPPERLARLEASGRGSVVVVKEL